MEKPLFRVKLGILPNLFENLSSNFDLIFKYVVEFIAIFFAFNLLLFNHCFMGGLLEI